MPYHGQTTEIGAYRNPHRSAFTIIENGLNGFEKNGAIVGTIPDGTASDKIPFFNAGAYGIDVPALAYSLPIKVIGNAPPGSTLPSTMPTDPKYYAGNPEAVASFEPGIYYEPKTYEETKATIPGQIAKPEPQYYGNGAPSKGPTVDPTDMQPRPPMGPTPAELSFSQEAARKAQAEADKGDKMRKALIVGGVLVAAYFLLRRG